MCAEKGRSYRHRAGFAETARGLQLPALGIEFEAVAGFDLDGGDAFGDQGVEPWQGRGDERRPSLACRVAFTVETMPPPARGISS